VEPRGGRTVTWAEFVEAALFREYRRDHGVPMAGLRAFIETLSDEFGALPVGAQTAVPERLVAAVGGQLVLTPSSESFLERVIWDGDVAAGWRPVADDLSPIRIAPDVRFGRPAVGGVSTEALWEQAEAGETVEELAETYARTPGEVRWAVTYWSSVRAAA
jgi:uncharacterized protein (DUF433 family)